jgi:hypothetical protein
MSTEITIVRFALPESALHAALSGHPETRRALRSVTWGSRETEAGKVFVTAPALPAGAVELRKLLAGIGKLTEIDASGEYTLGSTRARRGRERRTRSRAWTVPRRAAPLGLQNVQDDCWPPNTSSMTLGLPWPLEPRACTRPSPVQRWRNVQTLRRSRSSRPLASMRRRRCTWPTSC